jgi:hypothetical protein
LVVTLQIYRRRSFPSIPSDFKKALKVGVWHVFLETGVRCRETETGRRAR